MAIEKIEMFTVNCDGCGENIGAVADYMAFLAKEDVDDIARKYYCTNCYIVGINGDVIILPKVKA